MSSPTTQAWGGAADRPPIELPHPVRMRILGAVMVGVFLAALDQTVVGTALPRIITDLGGNNLYTWAFTAYLLTSTISGPLYGKVSDLFGRRPVFLFGISVFMVGSLFAGLSQEMWQLVVARGIQGLGAGALFPIAMAVMADIFAPSERGRYQGLFGAVFGVSSLLGPAVGGLITDTIGWPFVFFLNLPIGAVVLLTVRRYLPAYHPAGARPKIDYLGAALFTGALVPILVGLTNKQSADWTDLSVGGLIALGVVVLGTFIWVESRAKEPIVPLDLFRNRAFSVSVGAVFLAAFGFFAAIVFLPRWFQVVAGASATISGYQMLPLLGGVIFSAVASGQIVARTGRYRWMTFAALVTTAVGLARADAAPRRHAAAAAVAGDAGDRPGRRADVRGVPAHRPEQRAGPPDRLRGQQPVVLPAGRRHGRPGDHGHGVRDVDGARGAVLDRVGRAPARGRRCAGRGCERAAASGRSRASATWAPRSSRRCRPRSAGSWSRSSRRSSTRSTRRSRSRRPRRS